VHNLAATEEALEALSDADETGVAGRKGGAFSVQSAGAVVQCR